MVTLRSGKTFESKEVEVEDEPLQKEENQPTVEIPTLEEPKLTKSGEVKSKLVNSDKLTPYLDADLSPRKICLVQPKVPSPPYSQKIPTHKQEKELQV